MDKRAKVSINTIVSLIALFIIVFLVWSNIKVKDMIERTLIKNDVKYEKVFVAGTPYKYFVKIYKVKMQLNKQGASTSYVITDEINLILKSSSSFKLDKMEIIFPAGLRIDGITPGSVLKINSKSNSKLNLLLDYKKHIIENIYIELNDISSPQDNSLSNVIFDIEGINIPLNEDNKDVMYEDREVKINEISVKHDNLEISAGSFLKILNNKIYTGWIDIKIKGLLDLLRDLIKEDKISKESARSIVSVLNKFVKDPYSEDKEININLLEESVLFNNRDIKDILAELVREMPEMQFFINMSQEASSKYIKNLSLDEQ